MRRRKRARREGDASLTIDPMVAWGVSAAGRAKPADDEPAPSAAILIILLGLPALLVLAGILALVLG